MNTQASTVVNMYFCKECDSFVERGCVKHQFPIDMESPFSDDTFSGFDNPYKKHFLGSANLFRQYLDSLEQTPKPTTA